MQLKSKRLAIAFLIALIIKLLSDCTRSGTPNFFSTEQVVQIVALACENPQASQRPVSHWSARELADEAINYCFCLFGSLKAIQR